MYLYPDNLKAKPTMWLWSLKDIVVIGILILLGVFAFFKLGNLLLASCAAAYAFLTIRFEDTTILSFISTACHYFLLTPQSYHWKETLE